MATPADTSVYGMIPNELLKPNSFVLESVPLTSGSSDNVIELVRVKFTGVWRTVIGGILQALNTLL